MKEAGSRISAVAIGAILVGAVALLAFNLSRMPARFASAEPLIPAKTDRPADVGNAAGEAFLRKVERPAVVPASGPIVVGDENFSACYDELYDHRDSYYGRSVQLSGFVMRQDDLAPGRFLVGRDLLWCCDKDKYFIGFLVIGNSIPAPKADESVIVRGVLEAMEYRNPENGKTFKVPAVRATYIGPADGLARIVYPR